MIAAGLLVGLVGGVAWYLTDTSDLVLREQCVAMSGGSSVELTVEQAENAATIAAVAKQRGLPARAVTIALATAYQESKIRNLEHGHADSLGIFQQRPSVEVWGTAEQIRDPYHATNRFYDALTRIDGYEEMEITVAAQRVQRSAFPSAYAAHEANARVLASALTGNSPAAFTCTVRPPDGAENDLSAQAVALIEEIERAFGQSDVQADGSRIVINIPAGSSPSQATRGWAMAHWLVANASRFELAEVSYAGQVWRAAESSQGWQRSQDGAGEATEAGAVVVTLASPDSSG